MAANEKPMVKVMLLGDASVGKSCLLLRASDNIYTENFISTIGVDFKLLSNENSRCQAFDTQGGHQGAEASQYIQPKAIIACFDVTDSVSFNNILKWIEEVRRYLADDIKICLVGNKCDNDAERIVSREVAEDLAAKLGLTFYAETSAKEDVNCNEVFEKISHAVTHNLKPGGTEDLLYRKPFENANEKGIGIKRTQNSTTETKSENSIQGNKNINAAKKTFDMDEFKGELAVIRKNSKRDFFFGKSGMVNRILTSSNPPTPQEIVEYAKYRPLGTVKEALDKFDISEIESQQRASFHMS